MSVDISVYFKVFFTFLTKASVTSLKPAILAMVKSVLSKRYFTTLSYVIGIISAAVAHA